MPVLRPVRAVAVPLRTVATSPAAIPATSVPGRGHRHHPGTPSARGPVGDSGAQLCRHGTRDLRDVQRDASQHLAGRHRSSNGLHLMPLRRSASSASTNHRPPQRQPCGSCPVLLRPHEAAKQQSLTARSATREQSAPHLAICSSRSKRKLREDGRLPLSTGPGDPRSSTGRMEPTHPGLRTRHGV